MYGYYGKQLDDKSAPPPPPHACICMMIRHVKILVIRRRNVFIYCLCSKVLSDMFLFKKIKKDVRGREIL